MSLKVTIPGVDFSGLGNPKVIDFVEGLPATGLSALYLFDDGDNGAAITGPERDRSGNGRDATLWAASNAMKTEYGVANVEDPADPANRGFGILSPVGITRQFTVFGVVRNLLAADVGLASSIFTMPWLSSGDTLAPSNPSTVGAIGTQGADDGRFQVNMENGTAGARNYAEIGFFGQTPNGSGGLAAWHDGSSRPSAVAASAAKDSWIAWALSLDADAGTIVFRSLGATVSRSGTQVPAQLWVDGQIALGGKHSFGVLPYSSASHLVKGEVAMAGVYSHAMDEAQMSALITAMKTRLAPRIPTIL